MIMLVTFFATPLAHAQVSVEIAKITCQQYLAFSVGDPRDVNIWLSGYYHGKQGSTVFEPQLLKQNAEKLRAECLRKDNSDLPVVQVIESALKSNK
jgi:hypothetical protein